MKLTGCNVQSPFSMQKLESDCDADATENFRMISVRVNMDNKVNQGLYRPNDGSMPSQRLRRWPGNEPTLGQRLASSGTCSLLLLCTTSSLVVYVFPVTCTTSSFLCNVVYHVISLASFVVFVTHPYTPGLTLVAILFDHSCRFYLCSVVSLVTKCYLLSRWILTISTLP